MVSRHCTWCSTCHPVESRKSQPPAHAYLEGYPVGGVEVLEQKNVLIGIRGSNVSSFQGVLIRRVPAVLLRWYPHFRVSCLESSIPNHIPWSTSVYLIDMFLVCSRQKILCETITVTETLEGRVHKTCVAWRENTEGVLTSIGMYSKRR